MVENPSHQNRVDPTTEASNTVAKKRSRYPVEDAGDLIECSGEYCSSCTATFVADCVAVCCCPCAIVNVLSLAFVKVPLMMGRRCWGLLEKKCRLLERKERRKCKEKKKKKEAVNVMDRDGNLRKERVEEGKVENLNGVLDGENYCARVEAERVWLELYQVGHLGFGRVSFTGIPVKGN